ncbi:MAG: respiratory nitrate reductase subunit gamma [Gallionellales bacterium RIFCSPLOWO2_12_FULL_59_22]|nr:MAG: respiratory nitrate reductase subunit gamma [Gallionellales bacterium RIFCSPLOWO2_02_FULL_59_110]OGT10831.1 MAG: respiratory nitrate reductase subunit gamma [Gallionellales bacterium RIFCSPLOWO2_12_FULL_59_22]
MQDSVFTLHNLLFGVYPYICLSVFFIGSWLRFDREQYTWKADSTQLLSKPWMRIASNFFHYGVVGIFLGHSVGLLTPHFVFAALMSDIAHQWLAIVAGTIFGLSALFGGSILLFRRFTNQRISLTSRWADKFTIFWIMLTLVLGLLTIPTSLHHATAYDSQAVTSLVWWVQSIVYLYPSPQFIEGIDTIFKLHLFAGMTVFLIFPFTRLVHIWSMPFGYLARAYQIVRTRRVKYQEVNRYDLGKPADF